MAHGAIHHHHPPHGTHLRARGIRLPGDLQPGRTFATFFAMNASDIIGEIHRVREKQAQECGFDPKRIGERIRQRQRERAAQGVRYGSFAQPRGAEADSCVVREERGAV